MPTKSAFLAAGLASCLSLTCVIPLADAAIEAPAPQPGLTLPKQSVPANINAGIDAQVRKMGFDPETDAGRAVVRWMRQIALDPDWRPMLVSTNGGRQLMREMGTLLSPSERETLLRVFGQLIASWTPAQCQQVFGGKGIETNVMAALTATQVNQVMATVDAAVKRRARGDVRKESYPIGQVMEADGVIEARSLALVRQMRDVPPNEINDMRMLMAGPHACQATAAVLQTTLGAPEPTRSIATWDLIAAPWRGSAAQYVLMTPEGYARERFSREALPAGLVARLPEKGAHPLGFSRIDVDGVLHGPSPHDAGQPYHDSIWNLDDSGVTTTFTSWRVGNRPPTFGHFETALGFTTLRAQSVGTAIHIVAPTEYVPTQYATVVPAMLEPEPLSSFREPTTQPSPQGGREARCAVTAKYPASDIAPNLTGDAADISCRIVGDKGDDDIKYQLRESYLYDYRVSLRRMSIDANGIHLSDIRKITITP